MRTIKSKSDLKFSNRFWTPEHRSRSSRNVKCPARRTWPPCLTQHGVSCSYGTTTCGTRRSDWQWCMESIPTPFRPGSSVTKKPRTSNAKSAPPPTKFSADQKQWLLDYYSKNPVAFLDASQLVFEGHFQRTISVTTVWRVLERAGLTNKVLE